ncbi:MBL fold metallo-hydrolase [Roseateles sp. L2-2]|uniref:MBL fold metallo-hydrolase n=1 Tax=Roseateles sp. L2-2 TaxID=3422597 RepID=UPI003D35C51C
MARSLKTRVIRVAIVATLVLMSAIGVLLAATDTSGLGDTPTGDRLLRTQQSPQWHDDHFENRQPIWADGFGAWKNFLLGEASPDSVPQSPVPVVRPDPKAYLTPPDSGLRMTWLGHATTLLEVDGAVLLIDPLWSDRASPVSWAGPRRWYPPLIALSDLPRVDAVLISHDHVDHLDMRTIVAMRDWSTVFVVPLGIGAHLERWGIPAARIRELDWWQSTRLGPVELVATPARHASGRLWSKTNKTLWAGWAVAGPAHRVWYSGDTGFHTDLAAIGERLGPFDLTLIESGQYDTHWPDTHLGPEQAVEAHRLVRGKVMVPVHWGLIQQAPHAWTEPIERVMAAARCHEVPVVAPRPGEIVEPLQASIAPWWPQLPWRTAAQSAVEATVSGDPADRAHVPACR